MTNISVTLNIKIFTWPSYHLTKLKFKKKIPYKRHRNQKNNNIKFTVKNCNNNNFQEQDYVLNIILINKISKY